MSVELLETKVAEFFGAPYGVAVDWFTPIGPLTFSLSQTLSKASTDETESFRFDLGTTF